MKLCLVIVTFNRVETLLRTLAGIHQQSLKPDYIVVVNNGSKDQTKEHLNGFDLFKLYALHLPENLGFGYGLSMGMKYAIANFKEIDFFVLMDDDSHPHTDLFKELLTARNIIGKPGMICTMGYVDYVWKGPVSIFNDPERLRRSVSSVPRIYAVDHVLVDGALIDMEVVAAVGTPREDVFMMCEDAEYSKRIKKAGFAISVLDDPKMLDRLHMGGGDRFSFSTRWRGYYHARNHLMILKKYFSLKSLCIYMIRQSKYLVASLRAPDRKDRIRLRLLGIYHGIIGKMGKTINPETYRNR
jgi:rhamnopyranosyl-N-acetylglucosaminyl-diphospho-decaprenol beta-1,3/1,4-galactofuranosyltransferase